MNLHIKMRYLLLAGMYVFAEGAVAGIALKEYLEDLKIQRENRRIMRNFFK